MQKRWIAMNDTASTTKGRISVWLKRRAFLIRMLVTTLLAGCIPLIIITMLLIGSEQNSANDAAIRQLTSVTASIARQFDSYVEATNKINLRMQLERKLYESAISVNVQGEIEALEVIEYMQTALPFVNDFGLYIAGDINAIYGMSGKYDLDVYASRRINMDPQLLAAELANPGNARFLDWNVLHGNMLYMIPIRIGSSTAVTRTGLYVISEATLDGSFSNLLSDQYGLAAIFDVDGRLVYRKDDCPIDLSRFVAAGVSAELTGKDGISYLARSEASAKGYRVVAFMNTSEYLKNLENLSSYVRTLAIVNIFICFALIIMVVMVNYQAVARVFRKIRGYDLAADDGIKSGKSELQYILDAFTDQVEEKDRLQLQLYEQHVLMFDRLLENLLEGQSLTEHDLKQLKLDAPYYYVLLLPLELATNVGSIISRNRIGSEIYAIEMYTDGYLTFLCGTGEATAGEGDRLARQVRGLLDNETAVLGISKACAQIGQLFLAYLEAVRSLTGNPPSGGSAAGLPEGDIRLVNEEPQDLSQLTYALKTGSEYALERASGMFDEIQANLPSLLAQRYACFQLVELYRRLSENIGITMDIKRLSHILQNGSLAMIRQEFLDLLHEQGANRKDQNVKAQDITYAKVMQYINENFTDPMFGMNNIADYLGMTIYTASRMLKTMIGINFRKYLNDMRIEYAKDLLLGTELSVNEIAEKSGFTSPSYFISIFRSSEGITPSNFRKR